MGSKTQTSTSSTSPTNPALLGDYQSLIGTAQGIAATPYQAYGGQLTAGLNGGQTNAIGELESSYGTANPYLNAGSAAAGNASSYAGAAAGLANPYATAAYMDPYEQNAVGSTMANMGQMNAEQQQGLASQAIGSGAFGGDRAGIAASSLANQQDLAEGQVISGMENTGWQQATAARQADAGIMGNLGNLSNQTAQVYGGLGSIAQSTAIQGASAGLQGATLQQQTDQAQDTSAYNQYLDARSYPFQTYGWLGNLMTGVGNQEGSTTVGTTPGPSGLSQATGAATAGLGILGASGAFGSAGWLTSDERAKENIEPIGETFDGQTIHRWNYRGDSSKTVHTGLVAQEVEREHPDAVRDIGGLKRVEYGAATDDAAARGRFANGGGLGALQRHAPRGGLAGLLDMERGPDGTYSDRGAYANGGAPPIGPNVPSVFDVGNGLAGGLAGSGQSFGGFGGGNRPAFAGGGAIDPDSVIQHALMLAHQVTRPRGRFDDGGDVGDVPDYLSPTTTASTPTSLDAGSGYDPSMFSPAALMGGSSTAVSTSSVSSPSTSSAPSSGLGVISSMPTSNYDPLNPTPTAGAGATVPAMGGAAAGSDPNHSNLWMGVLSAGLGMMGGTSPFAGVNIGKGAEQGLQTYQSLQQFDRQNALAQSDVAYKQGMLGLENRKESNAEALQLAQINGRRQMFGLQPVTSLAGLNAPSASSAPTGLAGGLAAGALPSAPTGLAAGTAALPAPLSSGSSSAAPAAGLGAAGTIPGATAAPDASAGLGALTASDPGSTSGLGQSSPTVPAQSPAVSTALSAANSVGASGGATGAMPPASDPFWKSVPPAANPLLLQQQATSYEQKAQMAAALGDSATAKELFTAANNSRTAAQTILSSGRTMVSTPNGFQMMNIPGSLGAASAQKFADSSADEAGKEAGASHTVYDPDGNPVLIDGQTYRSIASKGGGTVNGVPVTPAQTGVMTANIKNLGDYQEKAVDFEKDYAQNSNSLDELGKIYQNWQSGRGTEAVADLNGYMKQFGVQVPGWNGTTAGFDAAYKSAVDQAFKNMAASGAQKAPATGLRESLMTSARPDAEPAAVYKIITDKRAALQYQHDMNTAVLNSSSPNVFRTIQQFQSSNPYAGYVNAARQATPLPKGMTQTDSNTVFGPGAVPVPPSGSAGGQQGNLQGSAAQPSAMALPAPTDRVVGRVYQTPKGPATWAGNGWKVGGGGSSGTIPAPPLYNPDGSVTYGTYPANGG